MIHKTDFSLRTVSVTSVSWYATVVVGWAIVGAAVVHIATASFSHAVAPLTMTAVLLVVLDLLPLVQGHRHDPQGVVMSTAFVCGMLILWGLWPAVAMVSVAALASDLRARKHWWKVLFNPAQYSVSVAAGALVMALAGQRPSIARPLPDFGFADLSWAVGACLAYFCVNTVLVGAALTFRQPFSRIITDGKDNAMSLAVLALAPLVVLVAQRDWLLLPLLIVPLTLLYYTARMSLIREHEAAHDALTGLPNRSSLRFELDDALHQFQRDGTPFGLLLVDMDDFKRVNDTLGHPVGDDLLVRFAERLRTSVRPSDTVARLGGDEFAVIVQDAEHADSFSVAERVRQAMQDPIAIEDLNLEVGVSIGIANCPAHSQDGNTLLRYADIAMYVAKRGAGTIETYSPERDPNSADRLSLLGQLRQALDTDTVELRYQPKVTTGDGTPLGFEALVRWRHAQRGFVPPDEFIPLAEHSGIMPLLTERVVTLAVEQMARWRDQGLHAPVAVNISPTDLTDSRLTRLIADQLRQHRLPARMLQLEITERIVASQDEQMNLSLRELREMGVTISLDDFGTGYSSLQRLQSVPVDELKIDRVFVSGLTGDSDDSVGIVRAMVELAHALGLPAIAEGVETVEEWRVLLSLGCDGVQGWQVSRPMTVPEATRWLRSHSALRYLTSPPPVAAINEPARSTTAG